MPPSPWSLQILNGPAAGRQLNVPTRGLVLGRSALGDVDVGLEAASVSARHARVQPDADGQLWVEDLGSANGTSLNGVALAARTLVTAGAELAFADIRARATRAAPVTPAVAPVAPVVAPPPPASNPQLVGLLDILEEDLRRGQSYVDALEAEVQGPAREHVEDIRGILATLAASIRSMRQRLR